mmetsp:Transcript_9645/g.27153  ORF Transcript_9645/g.27153 Transcript_9645/m.27153 type:complete len:200 (-) Transcript_9645:555-1154(-)
MSGNEPVGYDRPLKRVHLLRREPVAACDQPADAVRRRAQQHLVGDHVEEALREPLEAVVRSSQQRRAAAEPHVARTALRRHLAVLAAGLQLRAVVGEGEPLEVLLGHLVEHPPQAVGKLRVQARQVVQKPVVAVWRLRELRGDAGGKGLPALDPDVPVAPTNPPDLHGGSDGSSVNFGRDHSVVDSQHPFDWLLLVIYV